MRIESIVVEHNNKSAPSDERQKGAPLHKFIYQTLINHKILHSFREDRDRERERERERERDSFST